MFSSMTDDDMSTCFSAPAAADGPGDEANEAGRRPAEAELPEEVAESCTGGIEGREPAAAAEAEDCGAAGKKKRKKKQRYENCTQSTQQWGVNREGAARQKEGGEERC